MNLNSPPSHFPMRQISHDTDHELYRHQPFLPNRAPFVSCHFFFDPTQDHTGFYDHHQLYRPSHVPDDQDYGGSTYEIKSKLDSSGLELGLWKKEDAVDDGEHHQSKHNPMKWMSSKMRVMQKMKHTDHDRAALKITSSADHKVQPSSSSAETDLSSNSSSYNNNNSPIRVCSDCNTTKTPLWRSGPKGPKSLCNACGIRQRKARRAMAAAAAAAAAAATNGATTANTSDQSAVKIKLQHKGKLGKNGHSSQMKKRCKTAVAAAATTAAGSPSTGLGFEDFLISLSKNLAFHHVFPDDEKDAAILLMALSSGLVNAIGSVRGVAYLHHDCSPKIIHRDIKSSNILLDEHLEPHVSDFGLAKLLVDEDVHITTVVAGTFGYLAPEYLQSGRATEKSDVYSFGVLLLELVTGKRPTDPTFVQRGLNVVGWMNTLLRENRLEHIVDKRCSDAEVETVEVLVEIAARCTDANPDERPSMQQVLQFLEQEVMSPCHSVLWSRKYI